MALLDLLGRRWSLRVLWELAEGPAGFRTLQSRCDGMSPSVLRQRLVELCAAGIVMQTAHVDYALTEEGLALFTALSPLRTWAVRWAERAGTSDRSRCNTPRSDAAWSSNLGPHGL